MSHLSKHLARSEVAFEYVRPPNSRQRFQAELLQVTEQCIVLAHEVHSTKPPLLRDGHEVIASGYTSVWFLYKNERFDVARFYRPDGTWTGYYADVLEPVLWSDADPQSIQPIVDLFLDLWISPSGRHEVLDEDEFDEAVREGWITLAQAKRARSTLDRLVEQTTRGAFPPSEVREFKLEAFT